MNTIKKSLFALAAIALLAGCKQKASFRKTPGGMPYEVFSGNKKTKVKTGDFIKVSLIQKIQDSVYFNSSKLPIYLHVAPEPNKYDIGEVWNTLYVGDSIIATQMMDTFILRSPQSIPPQFKKGDKIMTYVKVLDVFPSDSAARADDEKGRKDLLDAEIKEITAYLSSKNITAQKTPSGSFVEVIKPGEGPLGDSGKYVTVMYTGVSFSGKKFDSNTDTSFHHTDPLPFVVGTGSMIKGFDEAVRYLKPGGVAKIYVPSMLGYGGQPSTPLIKPYEHLIFDIELKEVRDKAPDAPVMTRPKAGQNVDMPQPKK